jgi:hypothetical protein
VSFVLVGVCCMCFASGAYTIVTRHLPPIFPDGEGGRSAPEIDPSASLRWGIGLIAFGVLLAIVTWYSTWLRGAV